MRRLRLAPLAVWIGFCLSIDCTCAEPPAGKLPNASPDAPHKKASLRVEELIEIVTRPAHPYVNSSGKEPQVEWRLLNASQLNPPYRLAKTDEQALLAAMRNVQFDLPARLCAARFLLELDSVEARSLVSRYVVGKDRSAANEAAYILVSAAAPGKDWVIGEMIRAVEAASLPNHAFINVVWELGRLKVKLAVPSLIKALKRNPEQNGHAAWALGEIGDPAAIPVLLDTVEIEGNLQDFQAGALHQLKSEKLLHILLRHLDDQVAVDLLADMKDSRAIAPMQQYLREHPEGPTSPFYLEFVLVKLQAKSSVDMATRLLAMLGKYTDENAQAQIVAALGETCDPRAVTPILKLAQTSNDVGTLHSAIHALATIKNNQAIVGLIHLLERDYSKVAGIGKRQEPSAVRFSRMIACELADATGQELGNKPQAWRAWLKERSATSSQ